MQSQPGVEPRVQAAVAMRDEGARSAPGRGKDSSVDGAPAARFLKRFSELLTSSELLGDATASAAV